MSGNRNFSLLQLVAGGFVFFLGFMGLFPQTIGLNFETWLELPLSILIFLGFLALTAIVGRLAGLGFGMSIMIPGIIAVFLLFIYFPNSPLEVGMMLTSSFGTAIATPGRA